MVNWIKTGIGGIVGAGVGFAIQFVYFKAIEPPSCPVDSICPKCGYAPILCPEDGSHTCTCPNCDYWCWTVVPPWMPAPIWPITVPLVAVIGGIIAYKYWK